MKTAYHILNGDTLLYQFPDSVEGTRPVCRECLVEGPVRESSLSQFFEERKTYLNEHYGKEVQLEYKKEVAALFYQILKLPDSAEINLWFEDDLFCQVNLWFCLFLLQKKGHQGALFLAHPPQHTPYAFGKVSRSELEHCYKQRLPLEDLTSWAFLWEAFQKSDFDRLKTVAAGLQDSFPFVPDAVAYHIERFPSEGIGRPKEELKRILEELNTKEFDPIFHVFCEREAHYGFGNLYVKRLYKELLTDLRS